MRCIFYNLNSIIFSLPVKLIVVIATALLFGAYLPEGFKIFSLTVSVLMKEVLVFLLPLVVFFLVFSSFSQLSGGFIAFTGLLVSLVCFSNFMALMTAYPVSIMTQGLIVTSNININLSNELTPYFIIHLPKICSNSFALITGVLLGICTSIKNSQWLKKIAYRGSSVVNLFLSKIFTPVLPIFILGFILKAQHDGLLETLFQNFIPLLSVVIVLYINYIGLLYLIVNNFSIRKAIFAIKNVLPAALVAFSAMSSAAAMPVLITGAAKNIKDKELTKRIIPFTINSHMVGDALAIPLIAMSLYVMEYGHLPPINQYIVFAMFYVLAKFASAAIPGGTILIMTPILESRLGFTSEMSSVILTIYLLFDPFCSSGSVLGNGAFVIAFEKIKNAIIPDKKISSDDVLESNEIKSG